MRHAMGSPVPPYERESMERAGTELRTALGAKVFAAAWEEGRVRAFEQTIACARAELDEAAEGSKQRQD